ncbi:MAG: inositol monophosphatase family protein [Anaerolineales bacterium]
MSEAASTVAPEDLAGRLAFAIRAAYEAGEILRQGYGHARDIGLKGEIDLVTEYDLRSEKTLVAAVEKSYPGESILAEESGWSGAAEATGRWLIDPLDGTTNFAHGLPLFCVSIAWALGEDTWVGVVYDPVRHELFHAVHGGGAWLGPPGQDPRRLHVTAESDLGLSLLVTGFPYDIRTNPDNNLDHFAAFALQARGVRRLGSAALDLSYVAAGRFDGYWELRLNPWDWAAGVLLVREAGGVVTRVDGGEDLFRPPTSLVAANRELHTAMLKRLGVSPESG